MSLCRSSCIWRSVRLFQGDSSPQLKNSTTLNTPAPLTTICRCDLTLLDLQHIPIRLPDSLPIFELLVLVTDEFPQLCVGVRDCGNEKQLNSQQLKFDIVELNSNPISAPGKADHCSFVFFFSHRLFKKKNLCFKPRRNLLLCFCVGRQWSSECSAGNPTGSRHCHRRVRK